MNEISFYDIQLYWEALHFRLIGERSFYDFFFFLQNVSLFI